MNELISIIVPVYNCEKFIYKALMSLKEQTYCNIEVIVIDDGSTDGSLLIAELFAAKDERFNVIHQSNAGVSSARNKGLSLAQGDYIGFVDADDVCELNQFECMYNAMKKNDADVAICSLSFDYYDKTIIQGDESIDDILFMNKECAISELFKGSLFSGHTPNKLFRREMCRNIYFDEDVSIVEDCLFCLKVFSKADRYVYINKPLYHYFIHTTSSYHQRNINKIYTSHISYERMKDIIESLEHKSLFEKEFYLSYMANIRWILVVFSIQKQKDDNRFSKLKEELRLLYKRMCKEMSFSTKIEWGIVAYFFAAYLFYLDLKRLSSGFLLLI